MEDAAIHILFLIICLLILLGCESVNPEGSHSIASTQNSPKNQTRHHGNATSHEHKNSNPYLGPYHGKIAFLFLTVGDIHFDDVWETFFTWNAPSSHYSIYWHTSPDYVPPPHSFFKNKQIKALISTHWADMSLSHAVRNMLREALLDKENEYFCLVSESCLPLLPFTTWYRSMMAFRNLSIVNACPESTKEMEISRWHSDLDSVPGLKREHWRKSAQWVALNRRHAKIVANDEILAPKFHHVVPSDEHYIPTLLAMHGEENATTCSDGFAHVYWENNAAAHPITYGPESIVLYDPPKKPLQPSPPESGGVAHSEARLAYEKSMKDYYDLLHDYEKHKSFTNHLRNTNTADTFFNGRCAYYGVSPTHASIKLPVPQISGDHKHMFNISDHQNTPRHLTEEAPCHFTARKFHPAVKFCVLSKMSEDMFTDTTFNLTPSTEKILHNTMLSRLRFNPADNNTYMLDQSNAICVPDIQIFGLDPAVNHHFPKLSEKELSLYKMGTTYHIMPEKSIFKLPRDNTVWYAINGTRRYFPDFDTFLKMGFSVSDIRHINYGDMQDMILGPPLPSLSQ